MDLNKFWQSITTSDGYDLKSKAWIINITLETVRFFVYNSSDRIKWIWAHKVDAQPGETIEVHGGFLQGQQDNLVVYRDNRGTPYNIKKNYLYCWTGSGMKQLKTPSTIECFRNQYYDPREQLRNQIRTGRSRCSNCCMCM